MSIKAFDFAQSRAKRKQSSAPTAEDLKIYEGFLKQAVAEVKHPKVIILGATPELRDLCIKKGCETIAVDFSLPVLNELTNVMKHKNSVHNQIMVSNWLDMADVLKDGYYDAILGDVSINNIPYNHWEKLFSDLSVLLSPGGYLIVRQMCFVKRYENVTVQDFKNTYDRKKTSWLMFWPVFACSKQLRKMMYNPRTKDWKASDLFKITDNLINKGLFKFRNNDYSKYLNLRKHGGPIRHAVTTDKDFIQSAGKYFDFSGVEFPKKILYSDLLTIYAFKKNVKESA